MTAALSSPLSLAGVAVYTPEDAMATMQLMARKVRQAIRDPYVVRRANEIIAAEAPRDTAAQIEAIRVYLETFFYFVDNPIGLQRVQPPAYLLHDIDRRGMTQGACDDAATLIAALGMADGILARLVAYAFGHRANGVIHFYDGSGTLQQTTNARDVPFTHVIADLQDPHGWVMLDVTRPEDMHRLPEVVRTLPLDL